jgi:hypothetical protein
MTYPTLLRGRIRSHHAPMLIPPLDGEGGARLGAPGGVRPRPHPSVARATPDLPARGRYETGQHKTSRRLSARVFDALSLRCFERSEGCGAPDDRDAVQMGDRSAPRAVLLPAASPPYRIFRGP